MTLDINCKPKENKAQRWAMFFSFLLDIQKAVEGRVVYIAIEHSLGFSKGKANTAIKCGLSALVEMWAFTNGFQLYRVHPATLKKAATGNGHASKEQMLDTARKAGYIGKSFDEADAFLMWFWAYEVKIKPLLKAVKKDESK